MTTTLSLSPNDGQCLNLKNLDKILHLNKVSFGFFYSNKNSNSLLGEEGFGHKQSVGGKYVIERKREQSSFVRKLIKNFETLKGKMYFLKYNFREKI